MEYEEDGTEGRLLGMIKSHLEKAKTGVDTRPAAMAAAKEIAEDLFPLMLRWGPQPIGALNRAVKAALALEGPLEAEQVIQAMKDAI